MSSDRFHVTEHTVPGQHIREYPRGTSGDQNAVLNICLKQYTPNRDAEPPDGAVTIIGAHANGFPKELYEPFWDDLLERSRGKFHIRSIWIADVAHQGDSYVVNEYTLADDPSWHDHSRDLLHAINQLREHMPRPLVGIGHSFGGCQLTNMALFHPRLLTGLVLLDPVLEGGLSIGRPDSKNPYAAMTASTFRRDLWKNTEAARAGFTKNPYYASWDPRAMELWLHHGFRKTPTAIYPDDATSITLKTPKHQEVWTFGRPSYNAPAGDWNPKTHPDLGPEHPPSLLHRPEPRTVFRRLPTLRPPTMYILGEFSPIVHPSTARDKVKMTGIAPGGNGGLAKGGTIDVTLKGVGHLVPMEVPDLAAQHAAAFLEGVLKEYAQDEREYRALMSKRTVKDNLMVSDEWKRVMAEAGKNVKPEGKPKL